MTVTMFVDCTLVFGLLASWFGLTLSHSGGQHTGNSSGQRTGWYLFESLLVHFRQLVDRSTVSHFH